MSRTRSLLELPNEILCNIFATLVTSYGVNPTVKARTTCIFNNQVLNAIWSTRALESPNLPESFCSHQLLTEYLVARTRADSRDHRHNLTNIILDTIDHLREIDVTAVSLERDYIHEACSAVVQAGGRFMNGKRFEPLDVRRILDGREKTCSLTQNALALSAYLGIGGVVQCLIEQGVEDAKTCFGSPFSCIVTRSDSSMTSLYLKARFQRRERHGPTVLTEDWLYYEHYPVATFWRGHPRDITKSNYDDAIKWAVKYGIPETVAILVKSAVEDYPLYHFVESLMRNARVFGADEPPEVRLWSAVLMWAVRVMRIDMVILALEHRANPNVGTGRNGGYQSALELAASNRNLRIFQLLLDNGADIHLTHREHNQLLTYTVKGGSLDIAKICLRRGVDVSPHWLDEPYRHPLVAAVRFKRPDMLGLFLAEGWGFEAGSGYDRESFERAVESENDKLKLIVSALRRK